MRVAPRPGVGSVAGAAEHSAAEREQLFQSAVRLSSLPRLTRVCHAILGLQWRMRFVL